MAGQKRERRSFMLWLAGVNEKIMERYPGDRARYVGIASAMLVTASVGALSAGFAVHMALHATVFVAVLLGMFWFFVIICIDRWLVASATRSPRWYQNVLAVVPRLVLALLIGLVVSTPLVLQIFSPEIATEVRRIHADAEEEFRKNPINQYRDNRIKDLRTEHTRLQGIIDNTTGVDTAADNEVIRRTRILERDRSELASRQRQFQACKATNCNNLADITRLRATAAQRVEDDKRDLQEAVDAAKQRGQSQRPQQVAQAKTDQQKVDSELANLQTQQDVARDRFRDTNENDTGLLIRMKALNNVTKDDPTLGRARLVLFLFFTAIEILPVLVKLLLNLGSKTGYEKAVETDERNSLDLEDRISQRAKALKLLESEQEFVDQLEHLQQSKRHRLGGPRRNPYGHTPPYPRAASGGRP